MTTAARASGPRLRVLRALNDGPVEDRAGRAVHRLCQAARFDRQDALAQVLARMDHEGLIRREVQGRRTYLIEITDAGRRLAGLSRGHAPSTSEGVTPSRLRFDALPPGPASTWNKGDDIHVETDDDAGSDPVVEGPVVAPPPRLIPAALREVAGDAAADIDYEVLAGVLLQTALRAIRSNEASESRSGDSEAAADSLRAEITANRSRIMDLEAQVRILEHNNRTLTEALARSKAAAGEALSPTQRDLAHLMAQKPTSRG
jgi:hypothetical protein